MQSVSGGQRSGRREAHARDACPKEKPECRVAGCGAALFLRQHDGFVFDPRSVENVGIVLFDRAGGLPSAVDDDLPF